MQAAALLVHLICECITEEVGNEFTPIHVFNIFQLRLHKHNSGQKDAASAFNKKH